jgi:galactokinase
MRAWRAPGRVNLIGEHVDYTGGIVVPFACDLENLLVTVPLEGEIVLSSLDVPGEVRIPLDDPRGAVEGWGRYVVGVVEALREAGMAPLGFRGVLSSTIPAGAGLSSSAALEAVVALAMRGGERPTPQVLQRAEHLAVGVPCGVMDQVAVLHGVSDHALAIDCAAVTWRPVRLPSISFVVIDTGTRRALDDGRYAQRRAEVDEGLERRLRHVESENRRVASFIAAMGEGDLETLGGLVDESHASLRDDFEVSSPELDRAVEAARAQEECLGARLVGAGFAGCVLALVRAGSEGSFAESIETALPGVRAIPVAAVDGAGELALD